MKHSDEVRNIVAGVLQIPSEQLDPDTEMTDVEGWDSLRNIMILSQLEEHYGIMFPEDDIFDLTSVKALSMEIEKLLEK